MFGPPYTHMHDRFPYRHYVYCHAIAIVGFLGGTVMRIVKLITAFIISVAVAFVVAGAASAENPGMTHDSPGMTHDGYPGMTHD